MKTIVKTTLALLCGALLYSCGSKTASNGQLTGVQDRPVWKNEIPIGMNYVKAGNIFAGQADEDINMSNYQRPKSITIAGFYMDDTEITNNEYRQFVHWVRDSIAKIALEHTYEDEFTGREKIDWVNYPPIEYNGIDAEDLEFMYYAEDEQINGKREIDIRKLKYTWDWVNRKKVARLSAEEAHARRTELIERDTVMVYPDTLVWMRDFQYAYNEPMTEGYFSHPAYDDYPVVGVTWKQARGFANWRGKIAAIAKADANQGKKKKKKQVFTGGLVYRLPTEYEFEYAARGGRISSTYPWGLNYLRSGKGCLLANFKPGRGDYVEDGGFYTVAVRHYNANDFGLYDMSGNVSEWTESQFVENAHSFIHDMNPSVVYNAEKDDPITLKRKVIRGGSWKDIGYFLQTGVRDFEYQDSAKSYIGFRTVASLPGRTLTD